MAGTSYEALIRAARFHLNAARGSGSTYKADKFWSDDELLDIARRGTTDMWAAVIDLNEEHYLTVDTTSVTLAASGTQLSGVPNDCFRVYLIEPADITDSGTMRNVVFIPRDYNHPEFIDARAFGAQAPTNGLNIFYAVTGQGTPQGAPTIYVAPSVTSTMSLRFVYIPSLAVQNYTAQTANPIPGESDNALIAWIVAYARGKEREDKSPDPAWLAVYATEKQTVLTRMTPRQVQEPIVVDGLFDHYWRY